MQRVVVGVLCGALVVMLAGLGVWLTAPEPPERPTALPAAAGSEAALDGTPAEPVAAPACVPDPALEAPPTDAPGGLTAALAGLLSHPEVDPQHTGVSVWIEGLGEVLAHEADRELAPASVQKVFTAIGALDHLGTDAVLRTEVVLTPDGDLVVVGGGDPTLTTTGPHSLQAMAARVRDAGVVEVLGALLVAEHRHDGTRRASGWLDWQIPAYTGPMSAFMVDRNRWRGDATYLADPALGNLDRLRAELEALGVQVVGPTGYASELPMGRVVATLESAPVADLVGTMLRDSDNQIADQLLKEVGYAATGEGSAAAAGRALDAVLAPRCVELAGIVDDGSGLSRSNRRSAREWRVLLQAIRTESWFDVFAEGLPVAARTGTLGSRLGGTAAADNVRAKTGTIIGGSSLAGYGTTAGGRAFVFAVVLNGDRAQGAISAIDAVVATIAGHAD